MKIVRIETFSRPNVGLVRITAESGESGWGQIATYEAADLVAHCLHRQAAPVVLGRDCDEQAGILDAILVKNLKFPGSYLCRALAAIETGLLDLRAKARGLSVCELLGGVPRPVRVYGSSMSRAITPKEEAQRMNRLRDEAGIEAFKVRVGSLVGRDQDAWPGRTEELIPTMRRELGDDVVIHADANGAYTPSTAIRVGRLLEDHGFGHFEEPCPYWEYDWTQRVTSKLRIPVAGGEQDNYLPAWKRMIRDHVVDIVQPDVCYVGGISRALAVASLAGELGMACTPHAANHSLVTVFTLHLVPVMRNSGPFMEFSIEDQRDFRAMFSPSLVCSDGAVQIPHEGFGWGVTVNEEWLARAEYQKTEAPA